MNSNILVTKMNTSTDLVVCVESKCQLEDLERMRVGINIELIDVN